MLFNNNNKADEHSALKVYNMYTWVSIHPSKLA